MITVAAPGEVEGAIAHARRIVFTAYFLPPGAMREALGAAARRGASVTVRLEGRPFRDSGRLAGLNRASAAVLRASGVRVKIVDRSDRTGPALHMKAAVCDGVAYLDDRNWASSGNDTVLRDDTPAHVRAVRAAALGKPATEPHWFWTNKRDAIHGEADLLHAKHARNVDLETESFGWANPAYAALKQLAARGVHCRLLVTGRTINPKSLRALQALAKLGVEIRTGSFDEKMAVVDNARAWTGSANCTTNWLNADQIDWGVRTRSSGIVRALEDRFSASWTCSRPLQPEERVRVGGGYGFQAVERCVEQIA